MVKLLLAITTLLWTAVFVLLLVLFAGVSGVAPIALTAGLHLALLAALAWGWYLAFSPPAPHSRPRDSHPPAATAIQRPPLHRPQSQLNVPAETPLAIRPAAPERTAAPVIADRRPRPESPLPPLRSQRLHQDVENHISLRNTLLPDQPRALPQPASPTAPAPAPALTAGALTASAPAAAPAAVAATGGLAAVAATPGVGAVAATPGLAAGAAVVAIHAVPKLRRPAPPRPSPLASLPTRPIRRRAQDPAATLPTRPNSRRVRSQSAADESKPEPREKENHREEPALRPIVTPLLTRSLHLPGRSPVTLMLPPRPERLHGRAAALSELEAALTAGRRVAVTAPEGYGKTALAGSLVWQLTGGGRRAPTRFPDGVFYHSFRCAPAVSAADSLRRFFNRPPRSNPLEEAAAALAGRRALLIFDDLHCLAAGGQAEEDTAAGLAALLAAAKSCAVLLIDADQPSGTRPPVGGNSPASASLAGASLPGAVDRLIELPALSPPAALELLQDWAGAAHPPAPIALALCAALDGAPLALRLLGSALAAGIFASPTALPAWLKSLPPLSKTSPQTTTRGQAAARVLFEALRQSLPDAARAALALCGALAPHPLPALPSAGALHRLGLLDLPLAPNGKSNGSAGAQLAHPLLHVWAAATPPPHRSLNALAQEFTAAAQNDAPDGNGALNGSGQRFERLRPHLPFLLAALAAAGEWQPLLNLAAAADERLSDQDRLPDRVAVCAAARRAAAILGRPLEAADWLERLGRVHHALGRPESAAPQLEQAADAYRQTGDQPAVRRVEHLLAMVRAEIGRLRLAAGRPLDAVEALQAAINHARQSGDPRLEALILAALAHALRRLGQREPAADRLRLAVTIALQLTDDRLLGHLLANLGETLASATDAGAENDRDALAAARDAYRRAAELAAELDDAPTEAVRRYHLGRIETRLGNRAAAREALGAAIELQPFDQRLLTAVQRALDEIELEVVR